MANGLNSYFEFLRSGLEDNRPFQAKPHYDAPGDTLFFYGEDCESYARRLNSVLTLFLSTAGDRLIGFKVKGIRRILTRMERLGLDKCILNESGIRLSIFLEFALVAPPDDPALASYETDLQQYKDVLVDNRELQVS